MKKQLSAQPLHIGDLFRFGWQLYNEHFSAILQVILWVYLPLNLLVAFLPVDWQLPGEGAQGGQLPLNLALLL